MYVVVCYGASLSGDEINQKNEDRMDKENPHIEDALLGRFKGVVGERSHSYFLLQKWIQRLRSRS